MKKLLFVLVIMAFLTGTAIAQDLGAPEKAPKEKSIEELQWQLKALQTEYLYLQERSKNLQIEFQAVQAELKRRQPTPATKPAEKSKDEPTKKK